MSETTNQTPFNFLEYKKLICVAFQTRTFEEGFMQAKQLYKEVFDEYLPYPIQDHPKELNQFMDMLQSIIDEFDLIELKLLSKNEIKLRYNLPDKFFDLFYPQPEQLVELHDSRERFGKKVYSHLYNENRVLAILESDKYQEYLETKRKTNKKDSTSSKPPREFC